MLSSITKSLIANKSISPSDVDCALSLILHDATELHTAAFLVAAHTLSLDHTPEFIAATVANLRKEAKQFKYEGEDKFVDIVGTGGDGRNTFNVSTTSAIVAAGTSLVKVAKHGGPASTSSSGASDLLVNLGFILDQVNELTTPQLLKTNKFVYMSGPVFHPILAKLRDLRRGLGMPTVFNLVGPLLNPAPIKARVLGVYTPSLGRVYAEASKILFPNTPALVVCGKEGLDEISPAGETFVWELTETGLIKEYTISPNDFGLPTHPLEEVASGTPKQNADLVMELVNNKLKKGNPIRDYVLMNTAGLLYISRVAGSFKEGVKLAEESIVGGGAKSALEVFRDTHTQLTHNERGLHLKVE